MKKAYMLILTFIVLMIFQTASIPAQASYTAEQKQAAKAWLSANGYAPTMEGAQQAYQDYLNGKFDENGNVTPQTEPETETQTETATAKDDNEPGKSKGNNKKKTDKKNPEDASSETKTQGQPSDESVDVEEITTILAGQTEETQTETSVETEQTEEIAESSLTKTDEADQGTPETAVATVTRQTPERSALVEMAPIIIGPIFIVLIGGIVIWFHWKKRGR